MKSIVQFRNPLEAQVLYLIVNQLELGRGVYAEEIVGGWGASLFYVKGSLRSALRGKSENRISPNLDE